MHQQDDRVSRWNMPSSQDAARSVSTSAITVLPSVCISAPQLSRRLLVLHADERCSRGKGDDLSHRGKRDWALLCRCLPKEKGKNEGNRDGPELVIRMVFVLSTRGFIAAYSSRG